MSKKLTLTLSTMVFVAGIQTGFSGGKEMGPLETQCVNTYNAAKKVQDTDLATCKKGAAKGSNACKAMYNQHMIPIEEAKVACLNSEAVKNEIASIAQKAKERKAALEKEQARKAEEERRAAAEERKAARTTKQKKVTR